MQPEQRLEIGCPLQCLHGHPSSKSSERSQNVTRSHDRTASAPPPATVAARATRSAPRFVATPPSVVTFRRSRSTYRCAGFSDEPAGRERCHVSGGAVKRSSMAVVGAVGLVVVAALISSVAGARHHAGAAPAAASPATSDAPPSTIPIGDIRRLPPPKPGDLHGALVAWSNVQCRPVLLRLDRLVKTSAGAISPACRVWTSPNDTMLALLPAEIGRLYQARVTAGPTTSTDLFYVPQPPDPRFVTVADDGSMAVCSGAQVMIWRAGRTHIARSFRPPLTGIDERCVTGALGPDLVRLADDRRHLVDATTGRTLRRMAQPAPRPVVAIAASSDGDIAIADAADGAPTVTVFGPTGAVVHPRQPLGRTEAATKMVLARGGGAIAFQTRGGWTITSLESGHTMSSPGGAFLVDAAFAPDGRTVAAATPIGIVFAALPDLVPRWFLKLPTRAVGWFDAAAVVTAAADPAATSADAPPAAPLDEATMERLAIDGRLTPSDVPDGAGLQIYGSDIGDPACVADALKVFGAEAAPGRLLTSNPAGPGRQYPSWAWSFVDRAAASQALRAVATKAEIGCFSRTNAKSGDVRIEYLRIQPIGDLPPIADEAAIFRVSEKVAGSKRGVADYVFIRTGPVLSMAILGGARDTVAVLKAIFDNVAARVRADQAPP